MKRYWAVLAALAVALTGCTGIPTSSAPQVIRSVDRSDSGAAALTSLAPAAGASARDIVTGFLFAIAKSPAAGHSAARQFLTSSAARKWQDDTTTVLDSHVVMGEVPVRPVGGRTQSDSNVVTVAVNGHPTASVDSSGVLTPVLTGTGTGEKETFSYRLVQAGGQWRIDQLPPGVLIDQPSFSSYHLRKLYFFDSAERVLVPDLRYSPLTGQALESWLLTQLLAGPRSELAQSVVNEVPEQVGKAGVQLGDQIVVELPGAGQLDSNSITHLGAQLAYTLGEFGRPLRLTDSGRTVQVLPDEPTFLASDFSNIPDPDVAQVAYQSYFIRDGAVIDGKSNRPIAGLLGQSARNLSSVALRRGPAQDVSQLDAAGVSNGSLLLGNTRTGLNRVALPAGQLSRPEWRPNSDEVWVGVGGQGIYRIRPGTDPVKVQITALGGGLPGQVLALRFSPDGIRLAAVVRGPTGMPAAWVGSVVVAGGDSRITAFEPITPALMTVTDVSWADAGKLYVVASLPAADSDTSASVWSLTSDGYGLASRTPTNVGLSGPVTSIAAAQGEPPLVSAADSIQSLPLSNASTWVNYPNSSTSLSTPGIGPVYCDCG